MKEIHLWGVKQNNLKNIEVKIPLGSFTVICGPSGSGKSSLAFETLFAEGQRRFIESMSNYARQFLNKAPKPDIEGINNIPPAISIEQKNSVKSSRSTVGTTTEIIDYLRLLFEKIGQPHCPVHGCPTEKESVTEATAKALKSFSGQRGYILVEIPAKNRVVEGKKLHSLLLQDGYLRILKSVPKLGTELGTEIGTQIGTQIGTEMIEISAAAALKKGLPKEAFYLVIDRLSFDEEERGRLADSLTQAYEASVKYISGATSGATLRKAVILTTEGQRLNVSETASCPICEYTPPTISSKLFSFNSPVGACPNCKGFGNMLVVDPAKVIPDPTLSLLEGALQPFKMPSAAHERKQLLAYCKKEKINVNLSWQKLPKNHQDLIWNGSKEFFGVLGLFEYLDQIKYKMHVRVFISRYRSPSQCPNCKGHRLRPEVQFITIAGKSINDLSALTIADLEKFFQTLALSDFQMAVAGEVFKQIKTRLNFLMRVGVHYLSMSRETRTLSGGEYQRLMLANQLGMGLSQTLYVLDEPTVGLHPRDNLRLISILKDIRNLGNTLVVVEHDHDVIRESEYILEIGPGSGVLGGEIVYAGPTPGLYTCETSNTASYLLPRKQARPRPVRPVETDNYKYKIELSGVSGHNLKNLNLMFPLNRFVVVTGVSGSGKSTLVTKTLYPILARTLELDYLPAQKYDKIEGVENIKNVLLIDQSPIGKSARSSPITYLKAFDAIRTLMSATPESKARGYTAGTFSLNVDGGRCPACRGTGYEEIDMQFMDNVVIPCDVCDGRKFRNEILEIQLNGKNITQILALTVKEAMDFFVAYPSVRKPLSVLKEVGLDYLQIGQPANSLSGGESQRLKIAKEFAQIQQKNTLYILDEPTTGLHFREVELLMKVLHKLIETGGSVIVVEHNQDVILNADYIIDLGPEGGREGGYLVAQGTPEEIMNCPASLTGQFLKSYLGHT